MNLLDALEIVRELADQNVLEGGEAADNELEYERERQLKAVDVIDNFIRLTKVWTPGKQTEDGGKVLQGGLYAYALQFWKQRYVLAMDGLFPCVECGTQMETEGERLALRCEDCCPK